VGKDPLHGNIGYVIELFEKSFKAKIDSRGRIYLPKGVRERLSLKPGEKVYIKINGESLIVYTVKAIKKQLAETAGNF
jgi:AbrB family looped-hinge helix DNA binding protein